MLRGERGLGTPDWLPSTKWVACEDTLVRGELGCAATTVGGLLGSIWRSALVLNLDRRLGWLLPPCPGVDWAGERGRETLIARLPSVLCPGMRGAGGLVQAAGLLELSCWSAHMV